MERDRRASSARPGPALREPCGLRAGTGLGCDPVRGHHPDGVGQQRRATRSPPLPGGRKSVAERRGLDLDVLGEVDRAASVQVLAHQLAARLVDRCQVPPRMITSGLKMLPIRAIPAPSQRATPSRVCRARHGRGPHHVDDRGRAAARRHVRPPTAAGLADLGLQNPIRRQPHTPLVGRRARAHGHRRSR